jgi:hypothetical protein
MKRNIRLDRLPLHSFQTCRSPQSRASLRRMLWSEPILTIEIGMRRRDFLGFVGVAVTAGPAVVIAQQPVKNVGFLSVSSPRAHATFVAAFKEGLKKVGFIEGQNLRIQYAWAEGRFDLLPELAAGLIQDKVDVVAAMSGDLSIRAAAYQNNRDSRKSKISQRH